MQFHLNGVKGAGNPLDHQFEGTEEPDFQTSLPAEVDVLIVGAGPAGQLLGAQLARFPEITTRIVEAQHGPLLVGNADGLQCRTLEIFQAFGFVEKVLKEAYWVNETTFWSPTEDAKGLKRSGRIRDTEENLSEMPHVILNQARMQDFWLQAMKSTPTRLEPSYSRKLHSLELPAAPSDSVKVVLERTDTARAGQTETVRARYVVGCDGARSLVRKSLGLQLKGDSQNQVWGVLDALVVTDFPDVRLKTAIHSASAGSIVLIPREGGYLVRYYIQLQKLEQHERVADKKITKEALVNQAKQIFHPFTFDVREIAHWSVYEVGQRLTDHFDDVPKAEREDRDPRVFITGDACHTHSAKAGQGMNVSMNDSFNLGWKLASVLRGQSPPKLLHTYTEERHAIAELLIELDTKMSRMFAAKPTSDKQAAKDSDGNTVDPADFQAYFEEQGRFMAGLATHYPPNPITSADTAHQHLASGFQIGTRFHSRSVLRVADAKPVQLGHVMDADGRWRIVIFGDTTPATDPNSPVAELSTWLEKTFIPQYTSTRADVDSVFDVRAVLQQSRKTFAITELPSLLFPHKGKLGLQDYEKAFTDEESYGWGFGDIYRARGISRDGCVVVVRPDQYVCGVWPLKGEEVREGLEEFFGGVLRKVGARDDELAKDLKVKL
ncbi:unnamed protein product [Zymoseptoria tritici ST99CH_1E4]|uniref:FAD-binding domain-containing protein n=1 Tax=Zymoseptoria tritici ST99CH_1E4 TaxID=1276532 RepID=A0A2H1GBK3_ZYMTR|nr:unnamed protein product [Zymoseptoria tritici ST99CH_1E4]